jgi:DNA-binding transcriptional LysR family regulator
VFPPAWASSRTKLIQVFYQQGLNPPNNLIETASFLAIFDAVIDQGAVGFVAHDIGVHFEKKGLFKILPLSLNIDLPPVGIMTLHGQKISPSTHSLITCLRNLVEEKNSINSSRKNKKHNLN